MYDSEMKELSAPPSLKPRNLSCRGLFSVWERKYKCNQNGIEKFYNFMQKQKTGVFWSEKTKDS